MITDCCLAQGVAGTSLGRPEMAYVVNTCLPSYGMIYAVTISHHTHLPRLPFLVSGCHPTRRHKRQPTRDRGLPLLRPSRPVSMEVRLYLLTKRLGAVPLGLYDCSVRARGHD